MLSNWFKPRRRLVLGSIDLYLFPDLVIAGSFLGSVASRLLVETLSDGGVRQAMFFGIAGGITLGGRGGCIGDVIIPSFWNTPQESQDQEHSWGQLLTPSREFSSALVDTLRSSMGVYIGGATSVCSLADQTPSFIERCYHSGVLAIDMESAFVAESCARNNVEHIALLLISDLLGAEWIPGFNSAELDRALRVTVEALASAIQSTDQACHLFRMENQRISNVI